MGVVCRADLDVEGCYVDFIEFQVCSVVWVPLRCHSRAGMGLLF